MTIADVLRRSVDFLADKGIDSPRVDAEHLLAHALGLSRIQLYTQFDRPLNEAELEGVRELLRRRGAREPLAYVLGEWGFRRLTLRTDARALVPRPETEVVVERCLALLDGIDAPRVLDVGVGSGAIALSLVDEHPGARVTAVDVSPDALALARENAERLGLDLDLREGGFEAAAEGWDLVVSNPPYVRPDELPALQEEVRTWEPRVALVGDGLHVRLAEAAATTWLVLEVGDGQAPAVAHALERLGYRDVRITPDLAGVDRVVEGRRA
ncbi:MAG: peptide chain release factor N(5)-glutamine methyltransferase [Pseudomonadota bacterium]